MCSLRKALPLGASFFSIKGNSLMVMKGKGDFAMQMTLSCSFVNMVAKQSGR